jgi:hypothetical protein
MGIADVVIGFAAQTIVSNLISGVFIITEKTMKIGDFNLPDLPKTEGDTAVKFSFFV